MSTRAVAVGDALGQRVLRAAAVLRGGAGDPAGAWRPPQTPQQQPKKTSSSSRETQTLSRDDRDRALRARRRRVARAARPPRAAAVELRPRTAAPRAVARVAAAHGGEWSVDRWAVGGGGRKMAGDCCLLCVIGSTRIGSAPTSAARLQQLLGMSEAEVRKVVLTLPALGLSVDENLRPGSRRCGRRSAERGGGAQAGAEAAAGAGLSIEENVWPTLAALRQLLGLSEAEVRKLVISQAVGAEPRVEGNCGRRWRRCGSCSGWARRRCASWCRGCRRCWAAASRRMCVRWQRCGRCSG